MRKRTSPRERAHIHGVGNAPLEAEVIRTRQRWVTKDLTRDDIRMMREMWEVAKWPTRYIGKIFGIEPHRAYYICAGKVYGEYK